MRVIFLDIDGVLNCDHTRQKIPGTTFHGIEDNKVDLLQRLVQTCGAEIVLSSDWKIGWEPIDKDKNDSHANYLDMKLAQYGLAILDKTPDSNSRFSRGQEIRQWLDEQDNVTDYVILDDERFGDFSDNKLGSHFVQTSWKDGLQKNNIRKAQKILMGELE